MKTWVRVFSHRNPFEEMECLQSRLAVLTNGVGARAEAGEGRDAEKAAPNTMWAPFADIAEDADGYAIFVDLPGVRADSVRLSVERGLLVLTGERQPERVDRGWTWRRVERVRGRFSRRFLLPADADSGRVQAEFKDGVLRVRVAKSETGRSRSIEVKAG